MVFEFPVAKCNRCGAEWRPRIAEPKQCPICHSSYWSTPRTRFPIKQTQKQHLDKLVKKGVK